MSRIALRDFSRYGLSLASLLVIAGGAMMALGWVELGDAVMISGAALLVVSAIGLANTPTGDNDAG